MRSVWFNMIFDFFSESCGYWRSRGICNHCVLARWMHSYPICCLAAQTLSHPQPGCAYNPWFGIQWQFTNVFFWEWNCYHFFYHHTIFCIDLDGRLCLLVWKSCREIPSYAEAAIFDTSPIFLDLSGFLSFKTLFGTVQNVRNMYHSSPDTKIQLEKGFH